METNIEGKEGECVLMLKEHLVVMQLKMDLAETVCSIYTTKESSFGRLLGIILIK